MKRVTPLLKFLNRRATAQNRLIPLRNTKVVPLFADKQNKKQAPIFSFQKTTTMKNFFQLFTLMLFGLFSHQSVNAQCQVTNVTADGDAVIVNTCPQDGNPDVVNFSNNNASGSNYAYAITDSDFTVLEIITNNSFDFDPAPPGNCLVWGFSYTGNLTGQSGGNVFSLRLSDECYVISQNYVSVVRQSPDGGTVATPTGETSIYECIENGSSNFVGFSNTSSSSASYRYVITDEQNNILGLPPTSFLDFSGAGPGVCRVWGLSYTGNITAQMGDNAATTSLSDNCFELSSNFITVSRGEVDGGQVSMPNGATYRETVAQDGNADVVMFVNTSNAPSDYAYAITNTNNEILEVITANSFDFDPAPSGTCRIWGFSYTGDITAAQGESVFTTRFSTGCFDISSTAITVYRRENTGGVTVDGGMVSMPDGRTEKYTCTQDGNADITMLQTTSAATANYGYVVTDDQNIILAFPPSNMVDTDGAPPGACRVWGVSYTGNITAQAGDDAAAVAISDGQFELSSNFVTINRDVPNGGTVATITGETSISIIAGDGMDDIIEFESTGTSNSNFTYVITDDQNNILGIPPANAQNFEGAGVGVCRVWGLSYTGTITAQAGDNAADIELSDDCFNLSENFIEVNRLAAKPVSVINFAKAKVSPNPIIDQMNLELDLKDVAAEEMTNVSVYNATGNRVYNQQFQTSEGANNFQMNLGHLQAGIYKIVLQNGQRYTNVTFVKNRM